jgi:hypothetical protein
MTMIARTQANVSWKGISKRLSGSMANMQSAARARSVNESAKRYRKAAPKNTDRVRMDLQIVGAPNPARNAYITALARAGQRAVSLSLVLLRIDGKKDRTIRRTSQKTNMLTIPMCRPETESRWFRPV